MIKRKRVFLLFIPITLSILLNQCASFNKAHTTNFVQEQRLVNQGSIDQVARRLELKARKGGREGVLYAFQSGYYYLCMKNYDKSRELFEVAEAQIKIYEERAKVSMRDIGSGVKASFASDMEIPYKGEAFEKIMVNTFQALNYLFKKDIEGANVEIRKAEIRQKQAVEKHQRDLKKIEKQKKEKNVQDQTINSIMKNYDVLDEYAAKVINSFQNGFTYFLGGLVYELNNNISDAYIDYRKSFSLFKNKYVLEKLIELSSKLKNDQDFENWKKMYGEIFNEDFELLLSELEGKEDYGDLIVINLSGNIPKKTQAKFSLWTYRKSFNVAFPFYKKNTFYLNNEFLEIKVNGNLLGETKIVLDFIPIVTKALKEKMPGIIIRQVIRLLAKSATQKEAKKRFGLLGGLVTKVVNTITERADLRGWYELPSNIQLFRTKIPYGESTVTLNFISDEYKTNSEDVVVDISKRGYGIIFVQKSGNRLSLHNTNF
jgi:hypothetical protein